LIGQTLSHFRITAKLGEGGMGQVYRAEDKELGREVAIKVLPEAVAGDPDHLERFRREAKVLASLNHPNIAAIYSIESAGLEDASTLHRTQPHPPLAEGGKGPKNPVHFLVMELVEGTTLDALMPATGLPLDRFLELAAPIADALASAHARGIVHRDLKPANVMVTNEGQRVKVLDFGLAKLTEAEPADSLTELPTEALTHEGIIVGTPHYMSPEQARGGPVDPRSDIFSLGVMLYEMAAGERPFRGSTSIELLSSVLKDTPPAVTETKSELPRHLGRVIGRCLEKAPVDRYQTARDVFNELRTLTRESTSGSRPSKTSSPGSNSVLQRAQAEAPWIAVLPFNCRSADLEDLGDGLTEDITSGLSRFSYLLVTSKNSAQKLQRESMEVRQIGQELGARYVMEGSIRRSGSKVRIGISLLDAPTGTHLWAETFDRDLGEVDIFTLQDQITDQVVATIADPFGVLVRSMAPAVAAKSPTQLTPYEAVLRFFLYQQRGSAEDHLPARTALEHAVEAEPGYANAWAALAIVLLDEDRHAFNPQPGALDRALRAAQRAVDADPANQHAHHALAMAHYYRRELGSFRAAAEHAIKLNPRDSNIIAMLGILMGYAGNWERGLELTTAAMQLNLHHPGWYRFTQFFYEYHHKRYAQALEIAQKINLPEYFATHYAMAIAHAQLGNLEEAKTSIGECLRLWPDFEAGILEGHLEKWIYPQPDLIEHIVEGLELASLKVRPDRRKSAAAAPTNTSAQAAGADPRTAVAIAVLPFSDMSTAHDQEYLCEGMAEEIMNALVSVPGIRVASRTSAFRASREGKELSEIGQALSVSHVLEGSVRAAGDRLRVTAQLTDVKSGFQLWSERFDRQAVDVFALQDDIAAGVVAAVQKQLTPGQRVIRARPQVADLDAYKHYLKGRHLRFTLNDLSAAAKAYSEAVRLDPSHGASWEGLAEILVLSAAYGLRPAHEAYAEATNALSEASHQGPSADSSCVRGMIAFGRREWVAAEQAFLSAIEVQPDHVQSRCWLGDVLGIAGRSKEALPHLRHAQEVDPLSPYPYAMSGLFELIAGNAAAAEALFEQALGFEADNNLALWGSGMTQIALERFDEGVDQLRSAVTPAHRGGFLHGMLGWALAVAGHRDEAKEILEELRARPETAPTLVSEAWIWAARGEPDEAFRVLDRAIEEFQTMVSMTNLPGFDLLRGDPRFGDLLGKLGLQ
jgi:TolB-like protein/Tfp pilus assembly protein PilF